MKFFILLFCLLSTLLIAETTIPGGAVSGIWDLESSPYLIQSDIIVELNSQLIIEAGVSVIFSNHVQLEVFGSIQAEGTVIDSIYFQPENIEVGWTGIRVYGTEGSIQDISLFSFCSFKYAKSLNGYLTSRGGALLLCEVDNAIVDYCSFTHNIANYGGGLHVRTCSPTIRNSSFRYNEGVQDAGGILLTADASPLIQNCLLEYNKCSCDGGGLYMVDNCSPTLVGLTIRKNSTNNFMDGSGGGISVWSSSPIITNCNITENYSRIDGGGIEVSHDSNPTIENCLISLNTAEYYGGGLSLYESSLFLAGCTINYNIVNSQGYYGGGLYIGSACEITFSEENKSDIYMNNISSYANVGTDIYSSGLNNIEVILDTFTVITPSNYFAYPIENFTFTIDNGIIEQTNQDLYVSPQGSATNSGFSADDPIKSIFVASLMAVPNPEEPLTIHLADGIYSPSSTNETFPIQFKSYLRIEGSGNSILDAEQQGKLISITNNDEVELLNLSLTGASSNAIRIENSSVKLTGLKIYDNSCTSWENGSILAYDSELEVIDSVIRDNYTNSSGVGFYLSDSDLQLRGCSIRDNFSGRGGALYINSISTIEFDPVNLNSIYNNSCAPYSNGRDLQCQSNFTEQIAVVLDTFTVMYPQNYHASPIEQFSFEISNAYVPQADSDLYVSPEGNNSNSGTSEDDPLKSFSYAVNILISSEENPHTIFLEEGLYSASETGEEFPVIVRDFVTIIGDMDSETILDAENEELIAHVIGESSSLRNLRIINGNSNLYGGGLNIYDADAELTNISITSCISGNSGGGIRVEDSNLVLNEIDISNCSTNNKGGGIFLENSEVSFTGVSIHDNSSEKEGGGIYHEDTIVNFSEANLSSIYNNKCLSSYRWGRDLATNINFNIHWYVALDTFTVQYPNSHFIHPETQFTISSQNYILAQYDADLYVSPTGSDENTGLSEDIPLKTISKAALSINSSEESVVNIHLDSGLYSESETAEELPVNITGYVNILGSGREDTIIDGENMNGLFNILKGSTNLEDLSLVNGNETSAVFSRNSSMIIDNVLFKNNRGESAGALLFGWSDDLVIRNTIFDNNKSIYIGYDNNTNVLNIYNSNTIINDCTFVNNGSDGNLLNYLSSTKMILLNNIFWNNEESITKFDGWNGDLLIDNSLIENGISSFEISEMSNLVYGANNLDLDPLFSTEEGSYQLQEISPCIDAGVAEYFWEEEQVLSIPNSMYNGSAPDLGACEFGVVGYMEETLPEELVPAVSKIWSNYPNPFNPSTTISFSLKEDDLNKADILIYNIKGQLVKKFNIEDAKVGMNSVVWNGKSEFQNSSASGVYLYTLKVGNKIKSSRKMILLK